MTPVIAVDGLTRRYRDQVALDDVSFELAAGSITGLLGRNGMADLPGPGFTRAPQAGQATCFQVGW